MTDKYITVTQLTKYLKYKLEQDPNLSNIYLKGEISNFKFHTRGHFYFTIKDETSKINAIMFSSDTKKVAFMPSDGMKVLIVGRIGVYETTGNYQIYVTEMLEDGMGALYIAFNQLKDKLEKEGLFKNDHKKIIPKFPNKIGIITASTGAAIKDILSTIKRRWPMTETVLFPSLVQGDIAKDDIAKNIDLANNYDLDVLIIGRGGGSIEDLWPFNEEIVARAIYRSKIPIISAVGHEIDFTISDFVADLRAPTPTAAAEMAVPNINDVRDYLNQIQLRLNKIIYDKINFNYEMLNHIKKSHIFLNPRALYEVKEQNFDNLYDRFINAINKITIINNEHFKRIKSSYIFTNPNMLFIDKIYNYNDLIKKIKINYKKNLEDNTNKYINLLNKLEVLSPITTLKRGYSITKNKDKVITNIKDVKINDIITIQVIDGKIDSEVIKIYE